MDDRGYEGMYSPFLTLGLVLDLVLAVVGMVCIIVLWCKKESLENVDHGHEYKVVQKGDIRPIVDQRCVSLVSRCD